VTHPIVVCKGVTKAYGKGASATKALRGIDLFVHPNELLMLVGPSGSGKTTLLAILAGMLRRDGGHCEVLGRDYEKLSEAARARHRNREIGFVFQAFNLIPTLTVAENIAIPLLIGGIAWREAIPRARAIAGEMGLQGRLAAFPRELSGGQQQRVAIARAVVHRPSLVICDEPTSSLDHETGAKVMQLLKSLAREPGRALVVVTHDNRILGAADRVARMDDGRIVAMTSASNPKGS
jgi:putative ABC transport system ATP-binding protein